MLHHSAFPYLNKSSVFLFFYSVNLAHLPLRLGRQEGVLMHHRINFHCFAICCTDGRTHGRTLHGRTDGRTDSLRVATHRSPFVRHDYCRIATTIQLYLVFVIVCVMKEIIFLLSITPLSSGSGHTRSYRYLTDYHIIGVCLYLFVVACTYSLVR